MSTYGSFEIEDADIVRLDGRIDGDNDGRMRAGWVNVGAFALRIELGRDGNLTVCAFPCGQEEQPLVSFTAMHADAMAAGATDNAADDGEDDGAPQFEIIGEANDPRLIDSDTNEPVLRPRHIRHDGNAYWLEDSPAWRRGPGGAEQLLMSAPLSDAEGAVAWPDSVEVNEDECAEFEALVDALTE